MILGHLGRIQGLHKCSNPQSVGGDLEVEGQLLEKDVFPWHRTIFHGSM